MSAPLQACDATRVHWKRQCREAAQCLGRVRPGKLKMDEDQLFLLDPQWDANGRNVLKNYLPDWLTTDRSERGSGPPKMLPPCGKGVYLGMIKQNKRGGDGGGSVFRHILTDSVHEISPGFGVALPHLRALQAAEVRQINGEDSRAIFVGSYAVTAYGLKGGQWVAFKLGRTSGAAGNVGASLVAKWSTAAGGWVGKEGASPPSFPRLPAAPPGVEAVKTTTRGKQSSAVASSAAGRSSPPAAAAAPSTAPPTAGGPASSSSPYAGGVASSASHAGAVVAASSGPAKKKAGDVLVGTGVICVLV